MTPDQKAVLEAAIVKLEELLTTGPPPAGTGTKYRNYKTGIEDCISTIKKMLATP